MLPTYAADHAHLGVFCRALEAFVNLEQDTQNAQILKMWQQPLPERVHAGETVADVRIVQVRASDVVVSWRENLSKFRVGDIVVLHRGWPETSPFRQLEIEKEGDDFYVLKDNSLDGQLLAHYYRLAQRDGWIIDRDVIDLRKLLLGAIRELSAHIDHPVARILASSTAQVDQDPVLYELAMKRAQQKGMNASQTQAFCGAVATDPVFLIQGPPGTGKTWVLAHLAAFLAERGQTVLITAFTHRAINNALLKVVEATGYPYVYKVGQENRADDLKGKVLNVSGMSATDAAIQYRAPNRGLIIGGTCYAVRTKRLQELHFDTIIFDEASQVTLPLAIAAMLAGDRYVFVGDHQQMPPVVLAEHRPEWVSQSVFERLLERYPATMLDITYRMNEEILAFPSRTFYSGRLRSDPKAARRRLSLHAKPYFYEILDPHTPDTFVSLPHTSRSVRSPEEARLVAALIYDAVRCGVPTSEIAVVTPYRAQARLIRNFLAEFFSDDTSLRPVADIVVDTVERIQGQERELVLVSLTTSDPGHAAVQAEFFFKPNRLNVAITRPRSKRIVVGSPLLFSAPVSDPRLQEWISLFEQLYHSSRVIQVSASWPA